MAVLCRCSELIPRLLKSDGSLLLAAKVLIISRLLHKKLSQRTNPPPYLEVLRNRLGSLRRRLLVKIDKRMGLQEDLVGGPLEAMCAFALVTSSSASDVLRHFLHIRREAIAAAGIDRSGGSEGPSTSLKVYIGTLKDVRMLIPAQLSSALQKLKSKPLLGDQNLSQLDGLDLDIHEIRLGDDISSFTPYIRHEDLSRADVERLMQNWSESTISAMLKELREQIQTYDDPKELARMRRQILELWLMNLHNVGPEQHSTYVRKLREFFVDRWLKTIKDRSASLSSVGEHLRKAMSTTTGEDFAADFSLWSPSVLPFDPSDGTLSFRETLIARSQGITPQLNEVHTLYDAWRQGIENLNAVIEALSVEKWQDCFDAYDEDLADDRWMGTVESSLNEEDPRKLQEALESTLKEAFQGLANFFQNLTLLNEGSSKTPHRLTFLLRILRYLRQHLPQPYTRVFPSSSFGLVSIKSLHCHLAPILVSTPLNTSTPHIRKALRSNKVPSKPLWEGDPPLPILPSPWVFKLLQNIVHALANLGSDIWSPAAVAEVKQELRRRIASLVQEHGKEDAVKKKKMMMMPNGTGEHDLANQESDHPTASSLSSLAPDNQIQLLLDILYISHATSVSPQHLTYLQQEEPDTAADDLVMLRTRLETETKLEATQMGRMEKSAEEYWRRTSLLFGLLVV